MNRTILLLVGIIAVSNVVYSFFVNSLKASFFAFEINIWVYRLIWSLLAVGILYSYAKKKKAG